jgi:hypothetical protein
MRICFCAVAVNYCSSDDTRVIRINAGYGNSFTQKVDIPVADAGVPACRNDYYIAVIAGIYCLLNRCVIARNVSYRIRRCHTGK